MNAYREPGVIEEPHQRPSTVDVIEEAWRICKARQRARIGKEPTRWRFFAHAEWRNRRALYAFMTPDFNDVLEARRNLGADSRTVFEIAAAMPKRDGANTRLKPGFD